MTIKRTTVEGVCVRGKGSCGADVRRTSAAVDRSGSLLDFCSALRGASELLAPSLRACHVIARLIASLVETSRLPLILPNCTVLQCQCPGHTRLAVAPLIYLLQGISNRAYRFMLLLDDLQLTSQRSPHRSEE